MDFITDCLTLFDGTLRVMLSTPTLRYFLLVLLFSAACALAVGLTRAAKPDRR